MVGDSSPGFIVPGLLGWAMSLLAFGVVAYLLGLVGMGNEDSLSGQG
jgi:hypothetical protein